MLKRMYPKSTAALVGAAMMMCTSMVAQADLNEVLEKVPADSDMFVAVSNLAEMNAKIAKMAEQTGLADLSPEMLDVLGQFKMAAGLEAGVNDNGSMLFVINLPTEDNKDGDRAYWLLPVNDYDAFVTSMGGNANAAITQITLMDENDTYVKQIDGYAVMSSNRELVEAYKPGNMATKIKARIGKAGQKYVDSADVMFFIDAPRMAEEFGPMLIAEIQQELNRSMERSAPAEQIQQMQAGQLMLTSMLRVAEEDLDGLAVLAEIKDDGISFAQPTGFKAGSEASKILLGGKSNAASLLGKVPANPYLFAASVDLTTMDYLKLSDLMIETVGQANPMVAQMYEGTDAIIEQVEGQSVAMYVPDQMALVAGNFLNQVTVYKAKDADKLIAATKAYMSKLNGAEFNIMPGTEGDLNAPKMSFETEWNDKALELGDVDVAQYAFTMQMPPEMLQGNPMAMMMGSGYSGYMAAKGDYVVQTTTLDQALLSKVLENLDKNNGLGSESAIVNARKAYIPANSTLEGYVNLGGIADMANMFIPMMGMPPVQVPEALTPITIGVVVDENSSVSVSHLPADNVKFIVDAAKSVMMMQQQMMPGMQGPMGEPGQAPPAPFY
ncbi:hypothetical protein KS4_05670 [Poriferisphaera corsica]|uniref:DUF4836 family protein n=1 Tax=Poriferisphaera corsica TaxID=2528020 RepID=A0A517YQP9_9BACT|nr:hypothetical protein [Poriferisphaera corsica]QDU32535.1 hypothetical protein KS4_05670 [Poriferisphaera corsica]